MNLLAKLTRRRPHIRINARACNPWLSIIGPNGVTVLMQSDPYPTLTLARAAAHRLSLDTGWVVKDVKA